MTDWLILNVAIAAGIAALGAAAAGMSMRRVRHFDVATAGSRASIRMSKDGSTAQASTVGEPAPSDGTAVFYLNAGAGDDQIEVSIRPVAAGAASGPPSRRQAVG
ncbi:MAG: hypothetical protein K2X74_22740 [Acetobacteraceae bacterium]|nr:hypothetical protein [Acetobacteraceae bacterium]